METVAQYLENFPPEVQTLLEAIRHTIRQACPEAIEGIAYKMPAYKLNGKPLAYFAGYKNHIGLYATPSGHARFAKELSAYKQGKGSVQFPLNQDIPYNLIAEMVAFRAAEIKAKKK